jgi:hypothetical protein
MSERPPSCPIYTEYTVTGSLDLRLLDKVKVTVHGGVMPLACIPNNSHAWPLVTSAPVVMSNCETRIGP